MMGTSLCGTARKMAEEEVLSAPPLCQEDCARIAARVVINLLGAPHPAWFGVVALDLASGLFGDEFSEVDEHQRSAWVQMCERALREEAGKSAEA